MASQDRDAVSDGMGKEERLAQAAARAQDAATASAKHYNTNLNAQQGKRDSPPGCQRTCLRAFAGSRTEMESPCTLEDLSSPARQQRLSYGQRLRQACRGNFDSGPGNATAGHRLAERGLRAVAGG